MKTRIPVLISAGTLALSLTACGGGAAEEEPAEATEAAEASEEGGSSVQDLVAVLGESVQGVDNYTVEMEASSADPELGDVSMTQTYEVMDDPEAIRSTMVTPYMGEMMLEMLSLAGSAPEGVTAEDLSTNISIVHNGGEVLLADPHGIYGAGTPWVRSEQAETADAPLDFNIDSMFDLVSVFSALEQIEETGEEQVDGVDTTVVEGTVTAEAVGALSEEKRTAVEELLGGELDEGVEATLWLDGEGFPMRLEFSDSVSEVRMEFSSIGETSFETPAEDEIGTM
ncbi:LolA-like protein [Nocardiopsis deserti]|uniref:hypothetical protein n=1 Tax=Nocardiopsis deserti TaxID=2605988 RepID=UPI001CC24EB0|nr:hypothetical protein [Nocardiopsis deserti]